MAEAAKKRRWASEYETIYILRPNTSPEDADKVAHRIAEVVARLGGKLTKVDNWGKRRLAYIIQKHTRGIFVYVQYVGFGDVVAELERNLRLLDPVVRFQTIRTAELVDIDEVQTDPEEVKFLPIEVTEDEEEQSLEQQLGLASYGGDRAEREHRRGGDELEAGEGPEADDEGDEERAEATKTPDEEEE